VSMLPILLSRQIVTSITINQCNLSLDSQKGDEIPTVTIMLFKELPNNLRLQNKINIGNEMTMDSEVPRENKTLNVVIPEIQIQRHPNQLCACTVTAEVSEQFC